MKIYLHGVRGSVPTSGADVRRYGGGTSCYEIDLGDPGHRVFIDSGTGLLDATGQGRAEDAAEFDILLSHFHWDHIEGLPFFGPVFEHGRRFRFHGRASGMATQSALEGALRPPWFPVALSETASERSYVDLSGEPFAIGKAMVTPLWLNHPQGVVGYRFDVDGGSVAFVTDHEAGIDSVDLALAKWARGVDVLFHDAQYTAEEYEGHRGWGHSTWDDAVDAAIAAEVGQLVLVSHAPSRTDYQIDALVVAARARFPRTVAGAAGTVLGLPR